MHKIDSSTATPEGLFTIGDPVGGTPATVVTDDWLNAVQTEIVNVVEAAGMPLEKPNNAQLLAAIQALIPPPLPAWRTGDFKLTMQPTPEDGWIVCDDGSIGSEDSSATNKRSAECETLFKLLWNGVSNTYAPVVGGRGASAADDWTANKSIGLTKMLGRALAVAGNGSGLSLRGIAQTVGAETHVLSNGEMPAHTHANTLSDPGHSHANTINDPGHVHANTLSDPGHVHSMGYQFGGTSGGGAAGQAGVFYSTPNNTAAAATGISINNASKATGVTLNNAGASSGVSISNASQGGDAAHNNMQPTVFLYAHIKL
ncbi:hypothetical protein [Bradyrhizobium sp.]|uniref:hypothetical protein n=1 Tax=Bradyrhizobium sp. TaxID=376 RepID=UPI0039E70A5A